MCALFQEEEKEIKIALEDDPISLSFALRYLNFFAKATALSPTVSLTMSPDVPIVVEYPIEKMGYIRYFLAPKVDGEDEGAGATEESA